MLHSKEKGLLTRNGQGVRRPSGAGRLGAGVFMDPTQPAKACFSGAIGKTLTDGTGEVKAKGQHGTSAG
jgi:hypothetical protein